MPIPIVIAAAAKMAASYAARRAARAAFDQWRQGQPIRLGGQSRPRTAK